MTPEQMVTKLRAHSFRLTRFIARKTGLGCWCCGEWRPSRMHWRRGVHPFAVATWCRACKFGACEDCTAFDGTGRPRDE